MRLMMPLPPPGGAVLTGCRAAVSQSPGTVPIVSHALAAWTITVVVGVVVFAGLALLLRAVCLESLDSEQDDSDEQVSGHVPSE